MKYYDPQMSFSQVEGTNKKNSNKALNKHRNEKIHGLGKRAFEGRPKLMEDNSVIIMLSKIPSSLVEENQRFKPCADPFPSTNEDLLPKQEPMLRSKAKFSRYLFCMSLTFTWSVAMILLINKSNKLQSILPKSIFTSLSLFAYGVFRHPTTSPCSMKPFSYTDSSTLDAVARISILPGKKGIGFIGQFDKMIQLKTSWYYNWGLQPTNPMKSLSENGYGNETSALIAERLERNLLDAPVFVPMAWDGSASNADFKFKIQYSNIKQLMKNKSVTSFVLGFNEPDHLDQSDMTVFDAIERWDILELLNVPLGSPSCAHPNGAWMDDFMKNVKQRCLRVDYVGVHYYGIPDSLSFQITMENYYNLYQKPLIITEFAAADWDATTLDDNRYTSAEVLKFVKEIIPWLEETEWILGYSWFSFDWDSPQGWISALFDSNDTLTPLGNFYRSIRSERWQRNMAYH